MSANKLQRGVVLLALAQILFSSAFSSQISDIVSKVNLGQPHPGEPLRIEVELINATIINRVEIAYRSFGQTTFKVSEMSTVGNSATATIPPNDLIAPFLEFYFILHKSNVAAPETYPVLNPEEHPFKVDLQIPGEVKESSIIILSPEQNDRMMPEELYISYSLLRADSTINPSTIKTYVDGNDVSESAVRSGNLVVVRPSMILQLGRHTIRVEVFDTLGNSVENVSWDFISAMPGITTPSMRPSAWTYNYNMQAETRNENIQDVATSYNRLNLSGSANYGQYRVLGNLYVTSEEKDTRQPQNRYYIGAESQWLKIGYGDHYPIFPDFVMNGMRVRGLTGNLTLGTFNLDVTHGEVLRHINSDTIKTFPVDSLIAEQQRDPAGAYGVYDATVIPVRWAKFSYGTFDRSLFAIRPSFGSRDGGHIGFSYLKSTDDMSSIRYGSMPKENAVFASDLLMPFDHHNVEISAQAAISATNEDITNPFTDKQIDSLYASAGSYIRTLSKIITVNEYLVPLNLKNMPTIAYEGSLALNYFDNFFKFTYLRHGNNFESFGQSFVRTDVVGYNVSDNLRLVSGQVLLSGGFEHLTDNTAETKPATTAFTTGTFSVGYFPKSRIPNITVAYLLASSLNDQASDSLLGVDDQTNRVFVQLGKEFFLAARQSASLGMSFSNRDDRTPRNLDTKNTTITLSDVTTYTIPLQTIVSANFISNTFAIPSGPSTLNDTSVSYTTLYIDANYRLLQEKLRLGVSASPTFGDIERTMLSGRAQYFFVRNISLLSQCSFYLYKNLRNDIIWSLILRADM